MNQVKFTCELKMLQKDTTGTITINDDIQPVNATFEMTDEHISWVSNIFRETLPPKRNGSQLKNPNISGALYTLRIQY